MAQGDITVLDQSVAAGHGAHLYNVASGTAILAGEPVQIRAVGAITVQPSLDGTPVCSTSAGVEGLFVGVAATNSTNTSSAAGTVWVVPTQSDIEYLISPTTAASWDTQAEYDALVGKRVTLANSATVSGTPGNTGSYTINATDSANNGCTIQALDIFKYPGKVAFVFRTGTSAVL